MSKGRRELLEWLKALLIALVLALLIRYFLFAPILVDGQSMMPTLHDKDRMVVNKIGYTIGEPKRFDIVVFHANEENDYIKRIIGLPGDHIAYKDDELYINGERYDEPYLEQYKSELTNGLLTYDFTLEQITNSDVVPEGHLFVLGDNRHHSLDSREIGFIPIEQVVGKANLVFWPLKSVRIVK